MKTAQEAAQELLDDTGQYSNLGDHISGSEIAYITSYFSDFEKEIRQDQKEKSVQSILKIKWESIHPQHAISAVMEEY